MPPTDAQESAPRSPPALARLAYEAYTATTGNLNWRGAKVLAKFAPFDGAPVNAGLLEELGVDELVDAVEALCGLEGVPVPAVYQLRNEDEPRNLDDLALDHLRKNLLCPAWDQLPAGVRDAWLASTGAVAVELHARVQCFVYMLTRDAVPWGTVSQLVHEVIDPVLERGAAGHGPAPKVEPFLASFLGEQSYSDADAAALASTLAWTLLELG